MTSPDNRPIRIAHKFSDLKPGETMYERDAMWLTIDVEKIKQPLLEAIESQLHGSTEQLVMACIDLTVVCRLQLRTKPTESVDVQE